MAEAALSWLDQLSAEQRRIALGSVPAADRSDEERRRWFYTPTDHGGLTIHQQRPAQQRAALRLVSTGLSTPAYVTVATTMGLENVLDQIEGFVTRFDRERGRDPGLYYLRLFGEPGGSAPWGWRFGGHHVSLNNLVVDGVLVSSTPLFLGADPAASPLLGGAVNRPLGRVEDLGRELVSTLRGDAARQAILLAKAPSDFVTANRTIVADGDQVIPLAGVWRDERFPDPVDQARLQALSDAIDENAGLTPEDHQTVAYTSTPKGIAAADLDLEQREILRALLGHLPGPGARRAVAGPVVRRRRRPGRGALRLGGLDRPGTAALLPAPGSEPVDRVGQHPTGRQPRPLGVAGSLQRLRAGRAGPAPGGSPPRLTSGGGGSLGGHRPIALTRRSRPSAPAPRRPCVDAHRRAGRSPVHRPGPRLPPPPDRRRRPPGSWPGPCP